MRYEKLTPFGLVVDYFIKKRDTTQAIVAERIYISQPAISLIMNGKRRPSAQTAELLMETLEVPPEQQAEFLLLASGHSRKIIDQVLTRVGVKGPRET